MKSVIVCEGSDDFEIIAKYLEKKEQWEARDNNINLQKDFELPKIIPSRGKNYGYYTFNNDKLVIWSVGGKDSLAKVYNYLNSQLSTTSSPAIDQIFFFLDRDENDIAEVLKKVQTAISEAISKAQKASPENNIVIGDLQNNQRGEISFQIVGKSHVIYIIPIIIPFDRKGCLEDMLMQAIAKKPEGKYIEGEYIVQQGRNYIENMAQNEAIKKEYFKNKARLKKKALFSAIMSVISPTRSVSAYRDMLNSVEWHEDETICEHLAIFDKYLKS